MGIQFPILTSYDLNSDDNQGAGIMTEAFYSLINYTVVNFRI